MSSLGEPRRFGRRKTVQHAMVEAKGCGRHPCIVRDFNQGKALLEFPSFAPRADSLTLITDEHPYTRTCEVVRRRPKTLSVRFNLFVRRRA